MTVRGVVVVLGVLALLAAGCGANAASAPPSSAESSASTTGAPAARTIGELGNLDAEDLRRALLGEPPYPSGWEARVDELAAEVDSLLRTTRLPDVASLDPTEAACAAWAPVVGHTGYATGAFFERQFFIAHLALLVLVAPSNLRPAAEEAYAIAAAAAAEQMRPDGDVAIVSRSPDDAIRTIGSWAAEHC